MKASIGRVVRYIGPEAHSNGAGIATATVTRAWDDHDTRNERTLVNLAIQPDMSPPVMRGSVWLYDTQEEGAASGDPGYAFWPARE
jgi:hypothetical protein